jgi:hypothetical protein
VLIDANVARAACGGEGDGFAVLGDELASIPLMWSEARSSLHLQLSNGEISANDARIIHKRLESCPVEQTGRNAAEPPGQLRIADLTPGRRFGSGMGEARHVTAHAGMRPTGFEPVTFGS